ncbi:MAG: 50S ribosomal protein L28 [Candidatus Magasanikbacteria bacterium RIFCSPHIGHO2_01_FULL_47_8]|uniref:Large ribosomal subunit protein bL28 n=1 Tax=Candidatus Magasanikbacteria bacterium RIFCSPHIGHO2_01_FULL_47_8 TaxID=1798673 RepID=A0A1F6MCX9_9BACT|nr:MAG: 50S ribosomal protein L28 [Candidatus Magasanikbacteria bacterium RIFCSPHIGHO2_01_FULL_47_8]
MSRACTLCGKSAARANHVSHSNVKVPRRQKPNLQLLKIDGKSLKACTTCRRTLSKKLA